MPDCEILLEQLTFYLRRGFACGGKFPLFLFLLLLLFGDNRTIRNGCVSDFLVRHYEEPGRVSVQLGMTTSVQLGVTLQ